MVIAVDRRHAPEVHVADLEGLAPGHGQRLVRWTEVGVNTCVDAQFSQAEILVGCKFEDDVVARGGRRPVQRRLGISGQVVTRLVPHGQPVGWCREVNRCRRCSTAPFVGEREGGHVRRVAGFRRMEDDALAVGVRLVFSTNGHQHVKRVFITAIEIILHGVVKVKGETGTALVAVGKCYGGGAV